MTRPLPKIARSRVGQGEGDRDLKYRDVDYSVVQGVGRQLWRWGFESDGKALTGHAATKAEAASEAERAIDRTLALKKLRPIRPENEGG